MQLMFCVLQRIGYNHEFGSLKPANSALQVENISKTQILYKTVSSGRLAQGKKEKLRKLCSAIIRLHIHLNPHPAILPPSNPPEFLSAQSVTPS